MWFNFQNCRFPLLKRHAATAAAKSLQSCPTLCDPRRQPTRLPRPWDSAGKNTGVGCHGLFSGCHKCGLLSSRSARASRCSGFSRWGARAVGTWAQQVRHLGYEGPRWGWTKWGSLGISISAWPLHMASPVWRLQGTQ